MGFDGARLLPDPVLYRGGSVIPNSPSTHLMNPFRCALRLNSRYVESDWLKKRADEAAAADESLSGRDVSEPIPGGYLVESRTIEDKQLWIF